MRRISLLAVLLVAALPLGLGACGDGNSTADDEAKIKQVAQAYADARKGYQGSQIKSIRIEGNVARANFGGGGFVLLRKRDDEWVVGAPEAEAEALGAPPAPENLRPCTPEQLKRLPAAARKQAREGKQLTCPNPD